MKITNSLLLLLGLITAFSGFSCDSNTDNIDGDLEQIEATENEADTELTDGDLDQDTDEADTEADQVEFDTLEQDTDFDKEEQGGLPLSLPFELQREGQGQALTDSEISEFTKKITGLWKQIDYFTWVYETCHGEDVSTGQPDYLIWWHDVQAIKAGDLVTFRNNSADGGSHNNAEPTAFVLAQAIGGYLMSGDEDMGRIVEQFAKSFTAMMKGFVYDENDTEQYVMARNIITQNHAFTLPSGKKKAVDYSDWYSTYEGWNANRVHYPNNPYWGDIYVTTMRSKDDVPFMYRATAWLPYVMEFGKHESVRNAAKEAYEYMQGFAKDIVDSGYFIRSKDGDGNAYIPEEDLASFVGYLDLFDDAECDARLSAAMLGYQEPLDIDCKSGQGSGYDALAGGLNYYNYSIVDHFHMNAVQFALLYGYNEMAKELLTGFITRLDRYQDPEGKEPGAKDGRWERDIALYLLLGASIGMPLNSDEARKIHKLHLKAVEVYTEFPNFDLWDDSVPDGTYGFRDGFHPKHRDDAIRIEDIAFLLEYCWSPFKNPAGVKFVDCDIIKDKSKWGEE